MTTIDTKRLNNARMLQSLFHKEVMEETLTSEQVSQMLVEIGEDPNVIAWQYQELIAEKISNGTRK